ncbi:hypothetical protein FA95DRAFT_1342092 [Auriscalpium vulgare]|uniref:Uncharacterized protein n=1 Tax=Auriscalpium vulgare TaxID=40419 RepID=A0ACB8RSV2_9AGAM|nr:hypothetical protein FA95DRAFT_1342092 [Auriscalpium vulgare]
MTRAPRQGPHTVSFHSSQIPRARMSFLGGECTISARYTLFATSPRRDAGPHLSNFALLPTSYHHVPVLTRPRRNCTWALYASRRPVLARPKRTPCLRRRPLRTLEPRGLGLSPSCKHRRLSLASPCIALEPRALACLCHSSHIPRLVDPYV